MSDTVEMSVREFGKLLRICAERHGKEYAAQWLAEVVRSRPAQFMEFFLDLCGLR